MILLPRTVRRAAALAAVSMLSVGVAAGASIEGKVALPKGKSTPVVNQRYEIVSRAGVLSTNPPAAIVFLEGDFPAPAQPAVKQVAQKGLEFVPTLLPIEVGTRVEFPNFDSTYHNIFSFSPTKRFDLGRYRSDERPIPSVLFDKPGLVTLRCDIHEHMRGLILVLATPHFTITDSAGHYRLDGLPSGHYVLKAWIDSRTTREQPVDIAEGATLHVDFP